MVIRQLWGKKLIQATDQFLGKFSASKWHLKIDTVDSTAAVTLITKTGSINSSRIRKGFSVFGLKFIGLQNAPQHGLV